MLGFFQKLIVVKPPMFETPSRMHMEQLLVQLSPTPAIRVMKLEVDRKHQVVMLLNSGVQIHLHVQVRIQKIFIVCYIDIILKQVNI